MHFLLQVTDDPYAESIRVWNFSGPYFPTLGLNMESISSYLVRMREITYQKNSEYGHISRSGFYYINTFRSNPPIMPLKAFQYSIVNS